MKLNEIVPLFHVSMMFYVSIFLMYQLCPFLFEFYSKDLIIKFLYFSKIRVFLIRIILISRLKITLIKNNIKNKLKLL